MLKKAHHKKVLFIVALIVAFVALLLFGHSGLVDQKYRNEWQLFKKPEQAAEVFFTRHTALPKKYTPGTQQTINFTLVAHDKPDTRYRYEIIQENIEMDTRVLLKSSEINLINNKSHSEESTITYADGGAHSKISVLFPELDQSIHYWVERQ